MKFFYPVAHYASKYWFITTCSFANFLIEIFIWIDITSTDKFLGPSGGKFFFPSDILIFQIQITIDYTLFAFFVKFDNCPESVVFTVNVTKAILQKCIFFFIIHFVIIKRELKIVRPVDRKYKSLTTYLSEVGWKNIYINFFA